MQKSMPRIMEIDASQPRNKTSGLTGGDQLKDSPHVYLAAD